MRVTSTRNPGLALSFQEAVLANLPEDGGLFIPAELTPHPDLPRLLALPFQERSVRLLHHVLGGAFPEAVVGDLVTEAFTFPVPLAPATHGTWALELFHGPTLAFKDFGARFLAAVLARIQRGPRTILTATSGDTGAAVASAFHGQAGVQVVVLFPAGRVSPLQERQLTTLGGNVHALAVVGSFDDCQALVKACFQDGNLAGTFGLTSANSINLARLVAQIPYHVEAVARLRQELPEARPLMAVPSGNFGNLCAGLYAQRLGLPVAGFVAATNRNRTVPDYLEGGDYAPRPSVATPSSAMDVGAPSNWERIAHLFGRDREALRADLRWGAVSDEATHAALRALWNQGYPADPHAAVAWAVLEQVRPADTPGVFLATAHPGKFPESLEALGLHPVLPERLAALKDRPSTPTDLPADLATLKAWLRDTLPAS